MTAEFLLTSLVVILLPGTGVLYTLALGVSGGLRAGLLAAFGCTLGILPHIAASIAGLAALLHTSALAFEALRMIGVAYLLFMAWSMLGAGADASLAPSGAAGSGRAIVRKGLLINILNPKLSLFFLAFLPQFVPPQTDDAALRMLALGGVFMALTFLVFALYGALAATVRRRVLARPDVMAWLRRGFAAAFGLMGLRLALAER